MKTLLFLLLAALGAGVCGRASAGEPRALLLWSKAEVDGQGIFFSQVVARDPGMDLPKIRLSDAPAFGQALVLSRAEIIRLGQKTDPEWAFTNWVGAEQIRITRLSRSLPESEIKAQLTELLQREQVKDRGELELNFTRSVGPLPVPDEAFTWRILDLPASGLNPSFVLRFELKTSRETLGPWQVPVTAKVWREIWVARSALARNQPLNEADVTLERRDVLPFHDAPLSASPLDQSLDLAESIAVGGPIYAHSVRPRPVVHRGQMVEAQLQDGTILISLKVEVLENGAPGQLVRVRNPQSKREFRGKVQNEQTILVPL
jgi:flagella basal body P-ring formation protein FlgA